MLNQKEPNQVSKLLMTDPLHSRQRYDRIRMQLKANRSIEDSVFVDIHKLGKHTCKML